MSKLSDYLKKQKVDPRRLFAASQEIESLRGEDRVTKLAKRRVKSGDEAAKEASKEAAARKPRSGRPISRPLLNRALGEGPVSGAGKTRILRAVNHVLTQKKKGEAALRDLF